MAHQHVEVGGELLAHMVEHLADMLELPRQAQRQLLIVSISRHDSALNQRGKEMILRGERKQKLCRGFGDRLPVDPVGGVEVGKVTGLAELLDAERRDALAEDSAEP